jgi:hypothetical protein
MVLDHQWQEHEVFGQYGRREGDAAVVCTTAGGHQKVQAALVPR